MAKKKKIVGRTMLWSEFICELETYVAENYKEKQIAAKEFGVHPTCLGETLSGLRRHKKTATAVGYNIVAKTVWYAVPIADKKIEKLF